ncbi:polyketide synthase [Marinobacterium nitratireducens]|uniref:Polyketide synthase n=1 Tax=Marinobacterium nitratireducens TaxID=518897 RepID=A0A917ZB76_9GAMM|nr:type I polyketide synthase [Marinobacterium nitratireducens]GGO79494.1 polyketide synthase [Marinobacterium nitratireducens]
MRRSKESIAIVGMAFRLPGDQSRSDEFWQALKEGRDLVGEIDESRWSKSAYYHPRKTESGKSYVWAAGVLSRIEEFDAEFFGISPREASQMDPQQRMLLELSWEALEDGAQNPARLAGSDCAVYVGVAGTDFQNRRIDDPALADSYTMTGAVGSIASNRISYVFDLHGPSMSVDTACSSSLVALHQACRSIWEGEASSALVGGVNLLLHPFPFVGFSRASMLSPDGRCKTFDETGNGYVRSEGCAVFYLKPLKDAERDGDPIHAVILNTGVNSDGRTNGITVPSSEAQADLLRRVYGEIGLSPSELTYLEAHGTGTSVGDPLETRALSEALAKARGEGNPLLIGSVKSNVGHLETASGMAGMVKVINCIERRALPPTIHLHNPNPKIRFDEWNLKPVREYTEITGDQRLVMGINSFGFGGANAHAVLAEYRAAGEVASPIVGAAARREGLPPLLLSARNDEALAQQAAQLAQFLREPQISYYDLAWTQARRRQLLPKAAAVAGSSVDEILQSLEQLAAGEAASGVFAGDNLSQDLPVALVFSGNGSQWVGMGRELLEREPMFAAAVDEVDVLLSAYTDLSIRQTFQSDAGDLYDETEIAQPALFALQVGLTRYLQAKGVRVSAVLGHSVGEIAAAWASGALSLADAVHVIFERSAAQGTTRGRGRMAAASMPADEMQALIDELDLGGKVEIAGINSPGAVTLAGPLAALEALSDVFEQQGKFFRLLDLDYAFHSKQMDPVRGRVLERLANLEPGATSLRYISTVTGAELSGECLGAEYWWDNIRQPVRFADAVESLIDDGIQLFIDVGPHPIMRGYINECLKARDIPGRVVTTLQRRAKDDLYSLDNAVFGAWLAGAEMDLERYFPRPGTPVRPPAYPWQRERHWYEETGEGYDLINRQLEHPLLGFRIKRGEAVWENVLDTTLVPYLADHVVGSAVVMPAAGYAEMALAAGRAWFSTEEAPAEAFELEGLEIRAPLVFEQDHLKALRFEFYPKDGSFTIQSRVRLSDDPWTLHAVGRLTGTPAYNPQTRLDLAALKAQASGRISGEQHYRLADAVGLAYGPQFQGVADIWTQGLGALARLELPTLVADELERHVLHPGILDACFQVLVGIFSNEDEAGLNSALIPVRVDRLRVYGDCRNISHFSAEVLKQSPRSVLTTFRLTDDAGQVLAEAEGCRFRAVNFNQDHGLPATYRYSARLLQPLANPELAPLSDIIAAAGAALAPMSGGRQRHFGEVEPLFAILVSAYVYEALQQLAGFDHTFTLDSLVQRAEIAEAQRPALQHFLQLLEDDGLLEQVDGNYRLQHNDDWPAAEQLWLALLGDYPAYLPELLLLGRCGLHLPQVLRGECDATTLLNPSKGSSLQDHLADSAQSITGLQQTVLAAVRAQLSSWPANRRLRVLQVGGGAGALARSLVALLPAERTEFLFTDADESLLSRAEAELSAHAFVDFALFDPTQPAADQAEVASRRFDLILATGGLHQADDLSACLAGLGSLLVDDGRLLLAEQAPTRVSDLTEGLVPGWWYEETNGKQVSRLMSAGQWRKALAASGFEPSQVLDEPAADGHGGFVLLAERPSSMDAGNLQHSEAEPAAEPQAQRWLLLADENGLAEALAEALRGTGQQVILARAGERYAIEAGEFRFDPLSVDSTEQLLDAVAATGGCDQVVQLMGLQAEEAPPERLLALQQRRCGTVLSLLQALERVSWSQPPHLALITAGAALCDDIDGEVRALEVKAGQAPLWGLGRVLMNEHPELGARLVDLDGDDLAALMPALAQTLVSENREDELLLSADALYCLRIEPLPGNASDQDVIEEVKLDFAEPGPLKHLKWFPMARQAPAPGEVAVRPLASGLNFRDVMYAMGLLSDEAVENGFSGPTLGMEFAGEVVEVGEGVSEFRAGDQVMGFASACFSTRVVTPAGALAKLPEGWSCAEAATVPTVFVTAWYALDHLARLQPGERVLIHGGAGGVGIAAIQIARYLGAEVFATAGSDEKRDFLRLMGVDHILDSRSLAYADRIMELTGGEGIDVVLNSLAGEAITKNLAIMRPFGRFLELGKRDFYENSKIGLRPFRNNISYFGIDADQLLIERADLSVRIFREVMERFAEGALRPLPHRVFPAARAGDAFRYMQQSKQIGKIVIGFDERPQLSEQPQRQLPALGLDADGCYLVTGGLSGFGLRSACWLAEQGARHLVLLSRSGMRTEEASAAIAKLEADGVQVTVEALDVTDRAALQVLFARFGATLPPLKGLIHAAVVFEDGLLRNMSRESLARVLEPKLLGALHLHELTADLALDFFVLYSSVTTYFGNPGQANYVAANAYLEALARKRRAAGLPGLYVAWGAIDDVGFLARNEDIKEALQSRMGSEALTSAEALKMLQLLLAQDCAGAAVMDFSWRDMQRLMPSAQAPKFDLLRRLDARSGEDDEDSDDIRSQIVGMTPEQVSELVSGLLCDEIAQILRLPAEKIDLKQSVLELGMDSLMGVELALAIEGRFGVSMPAMALSQGPTIARITERIVAQLCHDDDAGGRDSGADAASQVARMEERHASTFSDEEAQRIAAALEKGSSDVRLVQ